MSLHMPTIGLAIGYLLLLIPIAILYVQKVPLLSDLGVAAVRMTLQLLFVGFYLQALFAWDIWALNLLWLLIMIGVADFSIARGCGLELRRFFMPMFISLIVGALIPMVFFVGAMLWRPNVLEAQFAIPIGGMILGNCMRAIIVGVRDYYHSIRDSEKAFLHALGQGARLSEATQPFFRRALESALAPTIATMATIGLVSLPGMMTGVILAGEPPLTAIKFQIAIMIAIFSGTAITVALAIVLTRRASFTGYGTLDRTIFR